MVGSAHLCFYKATVTVAFTVLQWAVVYKQLWSRKVLLTMHILSGRASRFVILGCVIPPITLWLWCGVKLKVLTYIGLPNQGSRVQDAMYNVYFIISTPPPVPSRWLSETPLSASWASSMTRATGEECSLEWYSNSHIVCVANGVCYSWWELS